jgi:hypothetical protein
MKKLMEIGWFILNLLLIELGFISFVLISLLTIVYGFSESRNSFLITAGCILLIVGIISMYFFAKEDKEKNLELDYFLIVENRLICNV